MQRRRRLIADYFNSLCHKGNHSLLFDISALMKCGCFDNLVINPLVELSQFAGGKIRACGVLYIQTYWKISEDYNVW